MIGLIGFTKDTCLIKEFKLTSGAKMKINSIGSFKYFSFLIVLILLFTAYDLHPQDSSWNNHHMNDSTLMRRQHMIHSMSPEVMPFNMNKVTHYFIENDTGGILMIKVKDMKDTVQTALVRSHLKKEYNLFSKGDFRDPKILHGNNMPGLTVLSESKDKYNVDYQELPGGAQLTFFSNNPEVIDAIHTWFDAQLRDHGSDAKSGLD